MGVGGGGGGVGGLDGEVVCVSIVLFLFCIFNALLSSDADLITVTGT